MNEEKVGLFLLIFNAEHGKVPFSVMHFMHTLLSEAFIHESAVTEKELRSLIMGEENEGGVDVPEELAERYPMLDAIAGYGTVYGEEDLFARLTEIRSTRRKDHCEDSNRG